jgi:hypothetical protein
VPNWELVLLFDQPPCTHVELLLGFAPVVKNNLLEYFSAFVVHEVIQFDKIDLRSRDTGA